jgi:hypothetical protein
MCVTLEHSQIGMTQLLLHHAWICAHPHQLCAQAVPESMEAAIRF